MRRGASRPEAVAQVGQRDEGAVGAERWSWSNAEHHHSGIALLTPADVHYGRAAEKITSARAQVLGGAYAAHPERFVRKPPTPRRLLQAVWINKPLDPTEAPQQLPG